MFYICQHSGSETLKELNDAEVRRLLKPAEVMAAIEAAFRERYHSIIMPTRTQFAINGGRFLTMPCHDTLTGSLGLKIVVVRDVDGSKGRKKQGSPEYSNLDRVQASYALIDPKTSQPMLTLAANYLTELRTAATSAVATKFLARKDTKVLGVFGTGKQARAHMEVLPLVRRFETIIVCGSDEDKSKRFTEEMTSSINLPIEAGGAERCAAESDVICTCTNSQTPLFEASLIRPGTHLNLVGSFQPRAREVDSATIQRANIVVDTYDGAMAEAGDLLLAVKEKVISRGHILADLHELVSGKKVARTSESDITLFKSVGCALEDLATVELLMNGWRTKTG